ncbi:MAG: hypothetical protein J0I17_10825 ['Candidatus Kapabacteria' thiocyanatum]|uniref:Uncharacterized protein n=1 Tax=Candidatus Kapaibacterium thiocyanatum TaxID=1895771 RepID=A0A1M3L3N7_9BACT|nr:hypothetical protein ['Candidatus Kapabacteria' thiocyanatum]OJX59979.1 MAG: hypothetical protein BGO89_08275 ['Candidatus Kapabacteria' thiocyanatum]
MKHLSRLSNEAKSLMRNRSALFDHDARWRLQEIIEELEGMFDPDAGFSDGMKTEAKWLWILIRDFQLEFLLDRE